MIYSIWLVDEAKGEAINVSAQEWGTAESAARARIKARAVVMHYAANYEAVIVGTLANGRAKFIGAYRQGWSGMEFFPEPVDLTLINPVCIGKIARLA